MPSHRKRRAPIKLNIPGRYLLLGVTVGCIALIFLAYRTDLVSGPLNVAANYLVVPFQNGISDVGSWLVDQSEMMETMQQLREENETLRDQNRELSTENTNLQQEKYELSELRSLYQLDSQYSEYDKTGARVIAKDPGTWYYAFIIDKGTNDGLEVDMNVLAGSGLVGRITAIGPDWARVNTIINDNVNVTAMILSNNDDLMVSGSLTDYDDGIINFSRLQDPENEVQEGDKVVTSNISDKYLPGILIGYIQTITQDANNLTKSGTLVPAVDFNHINTVLVILQRKQTLPEDTTVSSTADTTEVAETGNTADAEETTETTEGGAP